MKFHALVDPCMEFHASVMNTIVDQESLFIDNNIEIHCNINTMLILNYSLKKDV